MGRLPTLPDPCPTQPGQACLNFPCVSGLPRVNGTI